MGSKVNKIFKNTVYLYGNTAFSMFVSLLSTRLILNALGKDDFGIFCIVGGAIALLGFINGGMAGATQRFINYAEGAGLKENKIKIFNASISIHLGISLISFVVLEIAFFFFQRYIKYSHRPNLCSKMDLSIFCFIYNTHHSNYTL